MHTCGAIASSLRPQSAPHEFIKYPVSSVPVFMPEKLRNPTYITFLRVDGTYNRCGGNTGDSSEEREERGGSRELHL